MKPPEVMLEWRKFGTSDYSDALLKMATNHFHDQTFAAP